MKILITGISGFIGQRTADRLIQKGHEVFGTGRSKGTKPDQQSFQYAPADLTNAQDCERITHNKDAIIHCAGKAGAWGAHSEYETANVSATRCLLEAARKNKVKRFVNISSPSIYFDFRNQFDLKETDLPRRFSNAYAKTKYLAEHLVHDAHQPNHFETISLRPRGVIGAGDRNWMPRIIALRNAGKLVQVGSGSNLADFTSVANLMDALELCLAAPTSAMGRTYNITNGTPELFWDVVESGLKALGLDSRRKKIPLFLAMGMARLSEIFATLKRSTEEPDLLPIKVGVAAYSLTLDISAAKSILKYSPQQSTQDGLEEFALWWRAQR